MIISRTSQYAIQALIYIATQGQTQPILNREIASRLNVPAPYLAKIMQNLCRGGLLSSFRGRQGGFTLRADPSRIDLMSILNVTEGAEFTQGCVLGLKRCSDETACPMHHRWAPIKQGIIDLLQGQTLDKLAEAVVVGKYRLADIPAFLPSVVLSA
jgi:Rrf2 family protein